MAELNDVLTAYLPQFASATVLVLGDVMLDQYISGDVRRISPEAPIPILTKQKQRSTLGGAANVANNIATLGARVILLGVIGVDRAGHEVTSLLQLQNGRIGGHLVTTPGKPTTHKTRYTSGSQQLLRVDEEDTADISTATAQTLLDQYERNLGQADVVVLSDYAKGVLSKQVLKEAITMARAAGKTIVADPKRTTFVDYSGVQVLTPNVQEITSATAIPAVDDEGIERAGRVALDHTQADLLLITRSEKGLSLIERDFPPCHLPAHARQVADVSGAGDTVVAAFSVMLGSGANFYEASHIANIAAGISVGKRGTATVSQNDLVEELSSRPVFPAQNVSISVLVGG